MARPRREGPTADALQVGEHAGRPPECRRRARRRLRSGAAPHGRETRRPYFRLVCGTQTEAAAGVCVAASRPGSRNAPARLCAAGGRPRLTWAGVVGDGRVGADRGQRPAPLGSGASGKKSVSPRPAPPRFRPSLSLGRGRGEEQPLSAADRGSIPCQCRDVSQAKPPNHFASTLAPVGGAGSFLRPPLRRGPWGTPARKSLRW